MATKLTGKFRLIHMDANYNAIRKIVEMHTLQFGGAAGAPESDAQKLPKIKKLAGNQFALLPHDRLVIQFKPDAPVTESATAPAHTKTYRIPITIMDERIGAPYEDILDSATMTSLRAPAASQPWAAGTWYNIDEYQLPAQTRIKVGHVPQDVRVDGAIGLQVDVAT